MFLFWTCLLVCGIVLTSFGKNRNGTLYNKGEMLIFLSLFCFEAELWLMPLDYPIMAFNIYPAQLSLLSTKHQMDSGC
jgi:hypothetical protein